MSFGQTPENWEAEKHKMLFVVAVGPQKGKLLAGSQLTFMQWNALAGSGAIQITNNAATADLIEQSRDNVALRPFILDIIRHEPFPFRSQIWAEKARAAWGDSIA